MIAPRVGAGPSLTTRALQIGTNQSGTDYAFNRLLSHLAGNCRWIGGGRNAT
jgi:hypothetical protein